MIPTLLMHVCLAGFLVMGLIAFVLWFKAHGAVPMAKLTDFYRRLPWPAKLYLLLHVATFIAYASVKPPTNTPPMTASAPRRTGTVVRAEPWRTGTNETWDVSRPSWGTVVESWSGSGAYEDWFGAGPLGILYSQGRVKADGTTLDVSDRPLSIVPAALTVGTNAPSRVWCGLSPWGSYVYTWENAYANRDTNEVVSVQLERFPNGDRIYRYANTTGITSRCFAGPRSPFGDSDGDGIADAADAAFMDPDADGDGIVDGLSLSAYLNHPLWRANTPEGEPVDIFLNEPVVAPAKAVLTIDTLRILLTTNAVYRLSLQPGVKYDVKLTTNELQPVNLSLERGED